MAQGREVGGVQRYTRLEDIDESWDGLLARADADPLFNSREWLTAWWKQYGSTLGADLDIRAVKQSGQFSALAFMHRRMARHRLGIRGVRLELLGTARGVPSVGFSERTDFIVDTSHGSELIERLAASLVEDASWDDLYVSYTPEGGVTHRTLQRVAHLCDADLRVVDGMQAWEVNLETGFDGVLQKLGSGTRARLMNGRKRLAKAGELHERVLDPGQLEHGWDIFSKLHIERWNRPLSTHWREFYGAVARCQAIRGIPVMSVLEFNGRPLSVLVNFRAARREYAIASAFKAVHIKRVSPGWVHFGMGLERACAEGIHWFDFLGGEGKNEQYKAAFNGEPSDLVCLHLVRSPTLKWSYRAVDALRSKRDRLKGRQT